MKSHIPPRLSVVIPALNESRRLPSTLSSIYGFLATSPDLLPAEIIVVDDGSTDKTLDVAMGIPLAPNLVFDCLRHENNRGKGAAVRTGFEHASGELVLLCDADLATPIEAIRGMVGDRCPNTIVIGSRAIDRSLIQNPQPVYRDAMGRCFNLLVRWLVLPGIRDTQCGFKLFPGWAARALASVQRLSGFAYDVELLTLARHWGLSIVERGVVWRHVESSRVLPGRHSAQMFRDLVRLALWKRSGRLARPPGAV